MKSLVDRINIILAGKVLQPKPRPELPEVDEDWNPESYPVDDDEEEKEEWETGEVDLSWFDDKCQEDWSYEQLEYARENLMDWESRDHSRYQEGEINKRKEVVCWLREMASQSPGSDGMSEKVIVETLYYLADMIEQDRELPYTVTETIWNKK